MVHPYRRGGAIGGTGQEWGSGVSVRDGAGRGGWGRGRGKGERGDCTGISPDISSGRGGQAGQVGKPVQVELFRCR